MKKKVLVRIIVMGIVLISLVSAGLVPYLSNTVTGSVTILEKPAIFLGDDEHGDDTIDDDYEIWATLTTDPQVKNCEINWNESWQAIDKTITSINHMYLSEGMKTVYYRCYDDYDNFITVNDSILIQLIITCLIDADCDDSDPYTEDVCNNPGTSQSYCSYLPIVCLIDNDCDDSNDYTEDVCDNPGTAQSSCSHLSITCLADTDCDDSNTYTKDVCNNPGTSQSYCSYLPIVCLTNSECGTDGWVESLTCSNDDVWQDYITYTCNDPGTSAASCSDSTALKLKEDCGEDYCESWENNYCKLDDVYHDKICHDKGCLDGDCFDDTYTEEEKVQECGISEYTGSNYCYDDNVYRDYITRGCSDSSCTESTSKKKIEDCTNGCTEGRCKIEVCKTICNFGRCYEYCVWQ